MHLQILKPRFSRSSFLYRFRLYRNYLNFLSFSFPLGSLRLERFFYHSDAAGFDIRWGSEIYAGGLSKHPLRDIYSFPTPCSWSYDFGFWILDLLCW